MACVVLFYFVLCRARDIVVCVYLVVVPAVLMCVCVCVCVCVLCADFQHESGRGVSDAVFCKAVPGGAAVL